MSEEVERQLAEQERRRQIAEQLRNEAPSLAEKLHLVSEQLEASEEIHKKAEEIIDFLVIRSKEHLEADRQLYKKLFEIMPKVVAEVKPE